MHIHVYPDIIILVSSLYEHLYMHIKTYIHYSTCLCAYVKKTKYLHEKKLETYVLHIDTYIHIYIYIYIYIGGWSGYHLYRGLVGLPLYIHTYIYIYIYMHIHI